METEKANELVKKAKISTIIGVSVSSSIALLNIMDVIKHIKTKDAGVTTILLKSIIVAGSVGVSIILLREYNNLKKFTKINN